MKTSENSNEYKLSCGCSCEYVNGKYITILCDKHETEQEEMSFVPRQMTKFRISREI